MTLLNELLEQEAYIERDIAQTRKHIDHLRDYEQQRMDELKMLREEIVEEEGFETSDDHES